MLKKFNTNWLFLIVPLFYIIAIIVYLSTEDCYQQYCATGWEVLKMQWPSFWWFALSGLALAIFFARKSYLTEVAGGATGKVWLYLILAILLLCAPWGKACTDKASGGVTAPGYKHEKLLP